MSQYQLRSSNTDQDARNLVTKPQVNDDQIRRALVKSSLNHQERATLLFLMTWLDRTTLEISVTISELSQAMQLSRTTVHKRLRQLEATGVISKIRGKGGRSENGRGYANIWVLLESALSPKEKQTSNHMLHRETAFSASNRTADETLKGTAKGVIGCALSPQRVHPGEHNSITQEKLNEIGMSTDVLNSGVERCKPDRTGLQQSERRCRKKSLEQLRKSIGVLPQNRSRASRLNELRGVSPIHSHQSERKGQ